MVTPFEWLHPMPAQASGAPARKDANRRVTMSATQACRNPHEPPSNRVFLATLLAVQHVSRGAVGTSTSMRTHSWLPRTHSSSQTIIDVETDVRSPQEGGLAARSTPEPLG